MTEEPDNKTDPQQVEDFMRRKLEKLLDKTALDADGRKAYLASVFELADWGPAQARADAPPEKR